MTDIVMKASSCHLPPALLPVLRGALAALHRAPRLHGFSLRPRPVQDAARIARKQRASGLKKESNPYEIPRNVARDSGANLIRDCCETGIIKLSSIEV